MTIAIVDYVEKHTAFVNALKKAFISFSFLFSLDQISKSTLKRKFFSSELTFTLSNAFKEWRSVQLKEEMAKKYYSNMVTLLQDPAKLWRMQMTQKVSTINFENMINFWITQKMHSVQNFTPIFYNFYCCKQK